MRHVTGDPIQSPAEPAGIVRASVDIAAPAADVFRALIDPCELAAWLGGEPASAPPNASEEPVRERDGRPSHWEAHVVAPDGAIGVVEGEYGLALPPHRLETTWRASWNDFALERVRFELVPIEVGGVAGTRVTVTHTRSTMRMHAPSSTFAGPVVFTEVWPSLLARLAVHVGMTGVFAHWSEHAGAPDSFEALHRAVIDLHGTK